MSLRTWSYSGTGAGTNSAGDAIPAGGFDPTLELRNTIGQVAFADDGAYPPGSHDSLLTFSAGSPPIPIPLADGDYTLRVEVKDDDFAGRTRNWAVDLAWPEDNLTLNLSNIDQTPGSQGISKVSVIGGDSHATGSDGLSIGNFGSGTLAVKLGGVVSTNGHSHIGKQVGSTGLTMVTGAGSQLNCFFRLKVGGYGNATLIVNDGGMLNSGSGTVGFPPGSRSAATVSGTGSQWNNAGELYLAYDGSATLTVEAGGVVSNTTAYIGYSRDSTGVAAVTGNGSQWHNSGNLFVGTIATGALTIEAGGVVTVEGTTTIGPTSSVYLNAGTLIASNTINDGGQFSARFPRPWRAASPTTAGSRARSPRMIISPLPAT